MNDDTKLNAYGWAMMLMSLVLISACTWQEDLAFQRWSEQATPEARQAYERERQRQALIDSQIRLNKALARQAEPSLYRKRTECFAHNLGSAYGWVECRE